MKRHIVLCIVLLIQIVFFISVTVYTSKVGGGYILGIALLVINLVILIVATVILKRTED